MIGRLVLALLALLVPPIVIVRRRDALAWLVVALWLAAVAVFFLLAWGPGAGMAILAGLLGFVAVLLPTGPKAIA